MDELNISIDNGIIKIEGDASPEALNRVFDGIISAGNKGKSAVGIWGRANPNYDPKDLEGIYRDLKSLGYEIVSKIDRLVKALGNI